MSPLPSGLLTIVAGYQPPRDMKLTFAMSFVLFAFPQVQVQTAEPIPELV